MQLSVCGSICKTAFFRCGSLLTSMPSSMAAPMHGTTFSQSGGRIASLTNYSYLRSVRIS